MDQARAAPSARKPKQPPQSTLKRGPSQKQPAKETKKRKSEKGRQSSKKANNQADIWVECGACTGREQGDADIVQGTMQQCSACGGMIHRACLGLDQAANANAGRQPGRFLCPPCEVLSDNKAATLLLGDCRHSRPPRCNMVHALYAGMRQVGSMICVAYRL